MVLILMFGSLFYGAYYLYRSHTVQPLQADLITIDTTRITQLRIHPPEEGQKVIQLQREENYWIASNGQVHVRSLGSPVAAILANLVRITSISIAAKHEDEWLQYGLSRGQGVRVEVFEDDELVEDFWVGNTVPDSTGTDSLSYIRNHQEQEVYVVRGLSAWPFRHSFLHFRPKNLLDIPAAQRIDSFAYQLPDTTFLFKRSADQWACNGLPIEDASHISSYLNNMHRIRSTTFVDDYDYNQPESQRANSLTLYLDQAEQPILINVYVDTLRELPYIIHSNQNPTTWFGSDSSGVYLRLFPEVDSLVGTPEQVRVGVGSQ